LAGETHLWTFVRVEGIEPTNNDAERTPRPGVIYRRYAPMAATEDHHQSFPSFGVRVCPSVTLR
jgi:hypothetical protein